GVLVEERLAVARAQNRELAVGERHHLLDEIHRASGYAPLAAGIRRAAGRLGRVLGLPDDIEACLFDLDGVLTKTAKVHAAAWKEMFDGYLRGRADRTGEPFVPFDAGADYDEYVDGRPRYDGVRTFLAARGIHLPDGTPDDDPGTETIDGLGNRKNDLVLELIARDGVEVYEGSVRYVRAARDAGLHRAVVSSSSNCRDVLEAAGILDLFEEIVDGIVAARERLQGKPAPDTFLAGARRLGVEAPRAGGFGCVVGVDRVGHADALRADGADIVVRDLAELLDGAGA